MPKGVYERRPRRPRPPKPQAVEARCRNCGQRIIWAPTSPGLPYNVNWNHLAAEDGNPIRGCRAATYLPRLGWDDRFARNKVAAPLKGSEVF